MGHHHFYPVLLGAAGIALLTTLPWPLALPAWLILAVPSIMAFNQARQALTAPITTGREGMLGSAVQVIVSLENGMLVRHGGEIWNAVSIDPLQPGDKARVTAMEGLQLVVVADDAASPPLSVVAQARRTTTQALERLHSRIRSLTLESDKRELAARQSLPAHEAAARHYLAQRQSLLDMRARLELQAQALQAELEQLTALESSLRGNSGKRPR